MDYWAFIVATFYLIGSGLAVNILFNRAKPFHKWLLGSTMVALSTHAVWLYQNIFLINGQSLPILNVVSLIGFLIALLSAIMSKRLNTGVLLPLIFGFNVINFIAVASFPSHFITHLEIHPDIGSHIILALLAYSILSIASLLALQLAYINYRLKNHKRPLAMTNMPPLMTLEKSLFQFIFIGFILLSCTLLTGFIFLNDMFAQGNAHKAILSIIAWIIYATLLWGHYKKGWRGQLIVYTTIIASSLLTLAYFGSRFVREIILN